MHVYLDDYHYCESDLLAAEPTMLEVGAFTSDLAFAFLRHYPHGQVVVYEAEKVNFASLKESVPGDSRVTLHHAAISPSDNNIAIHRYTNRYSNSTFDRSCDGRELVDVQQVRGVTLSTALRENGLGFLDFLLLNCEGCELFALRELAESASLRARVGQICVSFHCLHSKMYSVAERDKLLKQLKQWFNVHIGNETWEYFLLTRTTSIHE